MSVSKDDPFAPILANILSGACDPNIMIDPDYFPVAKEILPFEARHVAENLILKRVEPAPWLTNSLAFICDQSIAEYLDAGHTFDATKFPRYKQKGYSSIGTPLQVYQYYNDVVGNQCCALASKLLFLRNTPYWVQPVRVISSWNEEFMVDGAMAVANGIFRLPPTINQDSYSSVDSNERSSPERAAPARDGEIPLPRIVRDSLDDWVMPALVKLKSIEMLAIWNFFAPTQEGETLLKRMGDVGHDFKWEMPSTKGFPVTPSPPVPPDSSSTHRLPPPDTSLKSKTTPFKANKKVIAPTRKSRSRDKYQPDPSHFLQTIWYRAVTEDSTFIVMNCGTHERIGVRHRSSQTLYLSDIIDPRREGYGRIHTGLALAILKDAIERIEIYISASLLNPGRMLEDPLIKSRTERKGLPETFSSKEHQTATRQRDDEGERLLLSQQLIEDEIRQRGLLLLVFDAGTTRSPAPSAFLRIGSPCISRLYRDNFQSPSRKSEYNAEDYLTVIAREPCMGCGASGVVYRVSVELQTGSGTMVKKNMILKLSHWDKEPDELKQEYTVYGDLASHNITKGIIGVYGLFEDMETGMLALLMDDAGKSLATITDEALEKLGVQINYYEESPHPAGKFLTAAQRREMLDMVKELHTAHFLHRDIRAENLMIDSAGEPKIIDFGRALFPVNANDSDYEEEMDELLEILGPGEADAE
ncbi:hypothetical protein D9613_007196 [Agrocybe pediades]|uniref:Protein kinase domain-containing protein n=1 Tax=Agrocybe pediades TaxID=84607 RepID=A0A8H4QI28_9AGAR|nr:hypothetical protein D9613_007196 [Agrocybe pediades]